jgi:hypothetical protein
MIEGKSEDTAPPEVIAAIVAEMTGSGLKPLSEEERRQRWNDNQLWLAECRHRDEQRSFEYEQERAAKAEAAQRERAIAAEEARKKTQSELRERSAREHEIKNLGSRVKQQETWRRNVERATRNGAVQRQQRAALDAEMRRRAPIIAGMERFLNPPPAPEPEVIYIEQPKGAGELDYPQPLRWR